MFYEFPRIHGKDDIERFRERGLIHQAFSSWPRDNGTVVYDYHFITDDVFPPLEAHDFAALARELRGLTFDRRTGRLLSRPYHKFFNAGERAETREDQLPLGEPHVVLEKLDGSMIHAFIDPAGEIAFATRSGVTDIAKAAYHWYGEIDGSGAGRAALRRLWANGYTPIFEWTSPSNIVVVQHTQADLVLTGLRHRESGAYARVEDLPHHAHDLRVRSVRTFDPVTDWLAFADRARAEKIGEGYVLRFASGHMIKVKNAHYARIHKFKARLTQEKDALQIVLEGALDDLLPYLTETDRESLTRYQRQVFERLQAVADRIDTAIETARRTVRAQEPRERQKEFWTGHAAPLGGELAGIAVQVWIGRVAAIDALKGLALKETASGPRVEKLAKLFGLPRWTFQFAGDL